MHVEGPWRMTWAEYGCRTGEFSAPGFDDSQWLAAQVPGDAHLDLMRVGLLPDPFVGLNTDAAIAWPFHVKKVYAAVKEAFAAVGRR